MAAQTEDVAVGTSEKLYHQRKQIEKIDKDLDETEDNLDKSKHILRGMKSLGSKFMNMFRKKPKEKKRPEETEAEREADERIAHLKSERDRSQKKRFMASSSPTDQTGAGVLQNKEDEQLDQLHQMLKNLGRHAEDMNEELDLQAHMLTEMDDKMTRVDMKTQQNNQTLGKMLR